MINKTKIAGAIATGALLATALLPGAAFANHSYRISGNGNNSTNTCIQVRERRVRVDQRNTATVRNTVVVVQNTGLNSASGNTTDEGNVGVNTGSTTSTVRITVSGNINTATVSP